MTGFYRVLLRLYPSSFRREYGAEMALIFEERAAAASPGGRLVLLLRAIAEVGFNAGLVHWEVLRQDLRYAVRSLRRAPGFAVTTVLVTALGVGANTAAFSVADFVLLRPLSYPEPESLVRLCEGPRRGPSGWGCMNQLSPANYRHFSEQTTAFEALGAFRRDAVNLAGGGDPERVASSPVTAEVLPLLGVRPLLGRVFDARAGAAESRTVVLGHGLWSARFGADPGILGQAIDLNGEPYTVIGVMPSSFHFPTREPQVWTLLQFAEEDYADPNNSYIEAVGRLRAGVTFEQARADLDRVVERLARDFPETHEETGVSFFRMRDEFSPRYRLMLQALCGAGLCILVLACANLGNLLLARAGARERELAVRSALGAGRERLVRQLFTEGIALASIGGAAGVLVSLLSFPLLAMLVPSTLPIGVEPGLDLRFLALAVSFTAITGLGFGVVPAIRAGSRASQSALREGRSGGRKQRYRAALVAIEVAASVVLLASSGLLIRALLRVQAVEPGFQSGGVLTLRTELPKPEYLSAERREQFYGAVLTEVRRLPGVVSAAYTNGLPMIVTGLITQVTLPGQEVRRGGDYIVSRRYVTPQLFRTMGIPLVSGRDFEDTDIAGARQVAVVSESFVERYWPNEDPLGRSFLFQQLPMIVIGVVGDIRVRGLERTSEPQMYLPSTLAPEQLLTAFDPKDLVIRSTGSPAALLSAVREIVQRTDPDQPISNVMTLSDLVARQTGDRRAQLSVLVALAAVALLLAVVGINGLLAYAVSQRQREIGVRLALGAEPRQIARRIVFDGAAVVLLGMIAGLLAAIAAGRSMSALLFGVAPTDPATILITLGLCLAMALTGAGIPAIRAARISPMSSLRSD